ncbi:hypothetical protein V1264_014640 [Littorina saxatilis]|uniref:Uncharacterized protein n=1 Tax=Littorina saxatilis TaxID=31220 RepID=A0AAN9BRM2_9CAEN
MGKLQKPVLYSFLTKGCPCEIAAAFCQVHGINSTRSRQGHNSINAEQLPVTGGTTASPCQTCFTRIKRIAQRKQHTVHWRIYTHCLKRPPNTVFRFEKYRFLIKGIRYDENV